MHGLWLATYALGIAGGALAGAALPILRPQTRQRTELFLSFSAGVMLGAAFFHMLPEAVHAGGLSSVAWVLAGFLFLFLLERYVLVHWCEEPEIEGCDVHGFHAHPKEPGNSHADHADSHHATAAVASHVDPHAARSHGVHGTVGLAAFIGFSIHTLTDGFALGAALDAGVGASVFLAILFHKIPSSFSLAAILLHERYTSKTTLLLSVLFSMAVPAGAAIYFSLSDHLDHEVFAPRSLAFSAGSFLHLAAADLLPDLHRNREKRFSLSIALLLGIAVMWALAVLSPEHAH